MLSVKEVALRLSVSQDTVRRWIRRGQLRAVKLGKTKLGYRIEEADVQRFLRERETVTTGEVSR